MDLRSEINQKKFANEHQKALINIIYTYNWLKTKLKRIFDQYGITMQQFNVLRILNGAYPKAITTSVIRSRMLDKMSDASRIVERLHKKGWVDRSPCPDDRRLVDVTISEQGRQVLGQVNSKELEMFELFGNLDQDECAQLNILLDKVRAVDNI